ncbi:hypothetical protein CEE37_05700 [candidate division LCP-89 bacterium B3_LCP]|uniref:Uncharacterized protein n=1 Tax=candidate division LCP-89 bacterium B3_LCP TaxID=2012998 RepID=A0A532V1R8_UNCL8|nr:MAG: hypothetical protein CEE37_05700 [candidate division LCP-89 bacterium B3_LCP]
MAPQLTAPWATAYLQVIVMLLVFALGIPALLFQLSIPGEIHRIIRRRMKMRWLFILMIFMVFASILFIWVLHPCGSASLTNDMCFYAALIITSIIALILAFWIHQFRRSVREKIVVQLTKISKKSINKKNTVDAPSLADLVYLGERGKPGDEKSSIIDAINGLAEVIQSDQKYDGTSLEDVINGIEAILVDRENQGSDKNFLDALETLIGINTRLGDRQLSNRFDAYVTNMALSNIGIISVQTKSESTALTFLEAVRDNPNSLFKMGVAALEAEKFQIATHALNRLEAIAEREDKIKSKGNENLFGMLAHFWVRKGSARRRAQLFFTRMEGSFEPSLRDCITGATEYHYTFADFTTADALGEMLEEV